jgi:sugar-specific transcriptional regulator TrmB
MSRLTTTLTSLGFSSSEARVYESSLREETTDVPTLSRLLGMNRATVYHAVHSLEQKGFLQKRIENGRLLISALREEGVEGFFSFETSRLLEQKKSLESLFASLPKQAQRNKAPAIEYFSGVEGVRMALEIAFRTKSKHWDILAPKQNFFSEMSEEYADYYLGERRKRHLTARTLWENSFGTARLSSEVVRERNPRFLPKTLAVPFRSVMILFDTRALFVSSIKEMQATLINSSDICSTLQMQFDALWSISTPAK